MSLGLTEGRDHREPVGEGPFHDIFLFSSYNLSFLLYFRNLSSQNVVGVQNTFVKALLEDGRAEERRTDGGWGKPEDLRGRVPQSVGVAEPIGTTDSQPFF